VVHLVSILVPLALALALFLHERAARRRRALEVDGLLDQLRPAFEEGTFQRAPSGHAVSGRRSGRGVSLHVQLPDLLEYRVEAPGVPDGWSSTDEARRQAVAAADRGAQVAGCREAVRHLSACGVHAIEARGGQLIALRLGSSYAFTRTSVEQALDALVRLAPLLQRAPIELRGAAGEPPRVAVAWTMADAILCPYCRDALAAETDDVDACGVCRTAHHRDCLTEAGGCTVFGCGGRPPADRQRAH